MTSMASSDFDFDYTFPQYQSIEQQPCTPPDMAFTFDPSSYLNIPYYNPAVASSSHHHARSSSQGSVYSAVSSTVDSNPDSLCSRLTTPPRASPLASVRQHGGPLLLPKIRPQDQDLDNVYGSFATPPPLSRRSVDTSSTTSPPSVPAAPVAARSFGANHTRRSFTNPDGLDGMVYPHMPFACQSHETPEVTTPAPLLCSPASFAVNDDSASAAAMSRRTSSCSTDIGTMDNWPFPSYHVNCCIPTAVDITPQTDFTTQYSSLYEASETSPLSMTTAAAAAAAASTTLDPIPSTCLLTYLTSPSPAASLVQSVSFPMRDPNAKHFWWDIRNVRSWAGTFNAPAILSLPGASALLTAPVPAPVLPQPSLAARHPETETGLHAIYASHLLPKLNAALAISSSRPLQLSVPSATTSRGKPSSSSAAHHHENLFTVNPAGESATAATMFGGKPTARVVGIVRSFDRFNTGMRAESNIKRVEYLRGLAAVHHAMREHGCRYGFIITEIELVVVRCGGAEATPFFGDLDITSVQLAASAPESDISTTATTLDKNNIITTSAPLTACLALWGLCRLAADDPPTGHPRWKADIGAPAEGTRRKAKPRDKWMPQPQLAEKREAKRSRGWVWPEDAIGRKELGKRGVKYGNV